MIKAQPCDKLCMHKALSYIGAGCGPSCPHEDEMTLRGPMSPCVSGSQHCWQGYEINLLFVFEPCFVGPPGCPLVHTMAI